MHPPHQPAEFDVVLLASPPEQTTNQQQGAPSAPDLQLDSPAARDGGSRTRHRLSAAQRFTLAWFGLDVAIGVSALGVAALLRWQSAEMPSNTLLWLVIWLACSAIESGRSALGSFSSRRTMVNTIGLSVRLAVTSLAVCGIVNATMDKGQPTLQYFEVIVAISVASTVAKILLVRSAKSRLLIVTREDSHIMSKCAPTSSSLHLSLSPTIAETPDRVLAAILDQAIAFHADIVEILGDVGLSAPDLQRLSWELRKQQVSLRFAIEVGPLRSGRVHCVVRGGKPLFEISAPTQPLAVRFAKRMMDVVGAVCLTILLSPLLSAIAVAVKLGSRGPAIYKQERVGLDGRTFTILKFRSMADGSDAQLGDLLKLHHKGDVPLFKVENDPRQTPLGAILRRYSLDELPQLFNVVGGSMSLVGPRPQRPAEVALYSGDAVHRLGVRPGMTGLWQVSGRSNLSWRESAQLDIDYAYNWSLLGDLQILARTLPAVIAREGAY